MKSKKKFRLFPIVFVVTIIGSSNAFPGSSMKLNPNLDQVRPGLLAYGDLWQLMFWRDGQSAGQMSSHNEYDLNIDLMNFHGRYKGGRVLARLSGPGVIYRIWSADPSGTLRFYADGSDRPTVSADFKAYLQGEDFSEQAFAVGRYTNYTPVPFTRSMIVTAKGFHLAGAYYQVSYMTFDQDPGITTLAADRSHQDPDALMKARNFFSSFGRVPARDPGGIPLELESIRELPPGESHRVVVDGAGLITELRLVDLDDPLDPLADLDLELYWDGDCKQSETDNPVREMSGADNPVRGPSGADNPVGEPSETDTPVRGPSGADNPVGGPSVSSPVDAFFGNRFDARKNSKAGPYETIAVSATNEGYSCRWPMPFSDGMKLVIKNHGSTTHRIKVGLSYRGLERLPENAMRFHALYREVDYPDVLSRDKVHGLFFKVDQSTNYVALERSGRGYYLGCFLYVISLGSDWWGEGDEMIWVDGDPIALIRGTGTEDEFNWSYGFKENRSPISGALRVGIRKSKLPQLNQSYNVLYRFRPGDFVPFQEYLKVTFERLGSTNDWMKRYPGSLVNVSQHRGDDYRSVAYWYELPGPVDYSP